LLVASDPYGKAVVCMLLQLSIRRARLGAWLDSYSVCHHDNMVAESNNEKGGVLLMGEWGENLSNLSVPVVSINPSLSFRPLASFYDSLS